MSIPSWQDSQACRAVLLEFLAAIDRGQASAALPLFTSDAEFDARGHALHGRNEIAEFLAAREAETHRQTHHVVVNDIAELRDGNVVIEATLMLYARNSSGTYALERVLLTTQTFRAHHDGWLIEQRRTRPLHPATDSS